MKRLVIATLVAVLALLGSAGVASADVFSAEPCEYPYEGVYGNVGPVDYQVCQNIIN